MGKIKAKMKKKEELWNWHNTHNKTFLSFWSSVQYKQR